jgi:hypothetical protein
MNTKTKYLAVALTAILLTVGVSVGAEYVMNSNIVNVPVGAQATLILASNATSAIVGDTIHLTSTCSDATYTGTVTFLDGATSIGTSPAVAGVATLNYVVSAAKTYQFKATGTHT